VNLVLIVPLLLLALPRKDEIPEDEIRIPLSATSDCYQRDSVFRIHSDEVSRRFRVGDSLETWPIELALLDGCGFVTPVDTVQVVEEVLRDTNAFLEEICKTHTSGGWGGGVVRPISCAISFGIWEPLSGISPCRASQNLEFEGVVDVEPYYSLRIDLKFRNSLTRDSVRFRAIIGFEKLPQTLEEGVFRLRVLPLSRH